MGVESFMNGLLEKEERIALKSLIYYDNDYHSKKIFGNYLWLPLSIT